MISHVQCTEVFYKREIELNVKGDGRLSTQDRKDMVKILQRFEEEQAGAEGDSDDDEEDTDSLARRLGDIDIRECCTCVC